jgi:capsular polysaccharide biosynthesis protein
VELRAYWTIIWRRAWLVALVVGVVALYVGYQYYHLRKTPGALIVYSSNVTVQIGLAGSPNGAADNVVVSEALADAMSTSPILSSKEFDSEVSRQIALDMPQIEQRFGANPDLGDWQNTGAIGGALSATHVHSLVTVSTTWSSAAGAWAIANAVGQVSAANICAYLGYVVPKEASCSTTADPSVPAVSARVIIAATDPVTAPGLSASKQTLLVILLLVALIVGIALAFLVEYLDDRIYNKDDAQRLLQLPVYGVVPRAPAVGRKSSNTPV